MSYDTLGSGEAFILLLFATVMTYGSIALGLYAFTFILDSIQYSRMFVWLFGTAAIMFIFIQKMKINKPIN